ncbi:MAG: uroporphyrinogen decarboxylase family protein [Holophaga sp.]|jgi:uroporphyrinogen decarboxylase
MNKTKRMDAVLKGKEPDRPPICMWYHFGNQHASGKKYAATVLEWFEHYDFDFLKLMNDYYYPMPEGLEEIRSAEDLARLVPVDPEKCDWKEQLRAIKHVAAELEGRAYFIDTLFDPWQCLQKSMAGEHLPDLVRTAPDALKKALDVVADNLIAYSRKSLGLGASGIFLSTLGARNQMDRDLYLEFAKPPALKLMTAIKDLGRMNTVHVHGIGLYTEDVLDFPVKILSWEDRKAGNPSLEELKGRWPGVVMGGVDIDQVIGVSTAKCRENVREGLRLGGSSRFILANGCSVPTWMDPHALEAMVDTAKAAKAPKHGKDHAPAMV